MLDNKLKYEEVHLLIKYSSYSYQFLGPEKQKISLRKSCILQNCNILLPSPNGMNEQDGRFLYSSGENLSGMNSSGSG